ILSNFYIGETHHSLGNYGDSIAALRRNVDLARGDGMFERHGGPGLVPLQSRFWLAFSLAARGQMDEALEAAAEAHRAARAVEPPYSFAFAEYAVGRLDVERRVLTSAVASLERARALIEGRAIVQLRPPVNAWLGYARALRGDVDDGVALLR